MKGIPFIGEDGFYPPWVPRGKWVFQRTLVSVGGLMEGYAEMVAARTPQARQVITWVPRTEVLLRSYRPRALRGEREEALHQLFEMPQRCYGDNCFLGFSSSQAIQAIIADAGVRPEEWDLSCPTCGGQIGPDLKPVVAAPIITRWANSGRPQLDNPAACAAFKSAPMITDVADWIAKSDPSHLELAYLGQQLWPDIRQMLEHLAGAA